MTEIVNPYQKISLEALKGAKASEGLSDQARAEAAGAIATVLVDLAERSPIGWNRVRWQNGRGGTFLINILKSDSSVGKVLEPSRLETGKLRQRFIEEGMDARSATAVTHGGLRTSLAMLQMGVETFEQYSLYRGRALTVKSVEPGKTHSTRVSSSTTTKFTSLRGEYNSKR